MEALTFLFPAETLNNYQENQFAIAVPGDGSYEIDRSFSEVLERRLQKRFRDITSRNFEQDGSAVAVRGVPPAEIFISQIVLPLTLVRPARQAIVEVLDVYNFDALFRQVKVLYPDRDPRTPDPLVIRVLRKGGRHDLWPRPISQASHDQNQGDWMRHVNTHSVGKCDLLVIKCFVSFALYHLAQTSSN